MNVTRPSPIHRGRLLYALAAALVVALGLLWRSKILPLSPFILKYGGDALWAVVVFLAFGFFFTRASSFCIALVSITFACSIEFLQLYHAPWIDSLRATLPGRLILGSTFNAPDLLAYALGILLAVFAETLLQPNRQIVTRETKLPVLPPQ